MEVSDIKAKKRLKVRPEISAQAKQNTQEGSNSEFSNVHYLKLFECETCHKCFKIKDNYNLHLQIHNEKTIGNQVCKICSKLFAGIDNLFKHMEEDHETIPYQTNEIKPPRAKKAKVVKPQFACEICKKSFKSNAYMKKHMLKICSKKNSKDLKSNLKSRTNNIHNGAENENQTPEALDMSDVSIVYLKFKNN